jgi:hypothetical protein
MASGGAPRSRGGSFLHAIGGGSPEQRQRPEAGGDERCGRRGPQLAVEFEYRHPREILMGGS